MTFSSRERTLIGIAGVAAAAIVGYVVVFMLVVPLMSQVRANKEAAAENEQLEDDIASTQRRNKKVLAEIMPKSLPADLDFSKREYESALGRMLREAKVPSGYTVRDAAPDLKGIPELAKGRPAYQKIAFTINMNKVDVTTLMAFLKKYYDFNLLHQITTFTIKRENQSDIGADKRTAKERADLNVTIVTEAILVDGAPSRRTLLSAPISAGAALGSYGLYSLENGSPEIGRGIAPYTISQILAQPNREYAHVVGRDVFHGTLPPPPPPVMIKKPEEIPPGPDISQYIQLVTLVKSSDGKAFIEIFDKWNSYDFEIKLAMIGEKLTVDAMRYLKTKKTDFYPEGRMKDASFPRNGQVLVIADDKSITKHNFKIYGVDGNALVLGETPPADAKSATKTGGGKTTNLSVDPKLVLYGALFAGVPVVKIEKFYRWEAGTSLKSIKELKPDEAQKAIQRASGGLLEVSAPAKSEIAPMPIPVERN